ncbi:unnamed protein product [Caenorhabditis angaria]|uniref:Phlebovirus glycoprotein G2 fusion domain-containing protein n=1 Tax=Caenorhabditis angaria TaxID=860376 RepID=A0A9P1IZ89_9PELO|nr:unnamed protein product [Caenorhabditis angaria]
MMIIFLAVFMTLLSLLEGIRSDDEIVFERIDHSRDDEVIFTRQTTPMTTVELLKMETTSAKTLSFTTQGPQLPKFETTLSNTLLRTTTVPNPTTRCTKSFCPNVKVGGSLISGAGNFRPGYVSFH